MIKDSEVEMNKLFLSYPQILKLLEMNKKKTKTGKEICLNNLRTAIQVMTKTHPSCRWKYSRKKKNKYYILIEGYYWLLSVYFQSDKKQIDADIEFFLLIIGQYEKLLRVEPQVLWNKDYSISELKEYFNRSDETIRKAILKMNKITNCKYRYVKNNNYIITKEGIEWLCKNCFKHKYLELLEEYKMELTEKYMEAGYPYDNF